MTAGDGMPPLKPHPYQAEMALAIGDEVLSLGWSRLSDAQGEDMIEYPPSAVLACLMAHAEAEGWDFDAAARVARERGAVSSLHLTDLPPRTWYFYSDDDDRSADWSNHTFGFTGAFYGHGATAQGAIAEAQSANRDDYRRYAEHALMHAEEGEPYKDTLTAIAQDAEQDVSFTITPTPEASA